MAEQSSPLAVYLLQLRCIFRFVHLFPAPHIKILPDNAADRILFFRNHGACSLSVASGEIYFIDYILPCYIAAEIFETDVPYFLFRRRVVTEAAP